MDNAFLAGRIRNCGIKIHINFGASRHFMFDVRMFASWNDVVPNITFNTVVSVTITSKVCIVGTLGFLVSNVHGDTRVATLGHAHCMQNQVHNLLSASQLTRQARRLLEIPQLCRMHMGE